MNTQMATDPNIKLDFRLRGAVPQARPLAADHLPAPDHPRVSDQRFIASRLDAARRDAQLGNALTARRVCADIMFTDLPVLVGDPRLLVQMVDTLLHAQGFQILSRLLAAVQGQRVCFEVSTAARPERPDQFPRGTVRPDGCTAYSIHPVVFAGAARSANIARWSVELAST